LFFLFALVSVRTTNGHVTSVHRRHAIIRNDAILFESTLLGCHGILGIEVLPLALSANGGNVLEPLQNARVNIAIGVDEIHDTAPSASLYKARTL